MIWLVWRADEIETDARRIDAQDCLSAAEEWARRDGEANPAHVACHIADGVRLRVRADGEDRVHDVRVSAEAEVRYSATRFCGRTARGFSLVEDAP